MEMRGLTDDDVITVEDYGTMRVGRPRPSLSQSSDSTTQILTDDKLAVS